MCISCKSSAKGKLHTILLWILTWDLVDPKVWFQNLDFGCVGCLWLGKHDDTVDCPGHEDQMAHDGVWDWLRQSKPRPVCRLNASSCCGHCRKLRELCKYVADVSSSLPVCVSMRWLPAVSMFAQCDCCCIVRSWTSFLHLQYFETHWTGYGINSIDFGDMMS